jgi:hypothetical protein
MQIVRWVRCALLAVSVVLSVVLLSKKSRSNAMSSVAGKPDNVVHATDTTNTVNASDARVSPLRLDPRGVPEVPTLDVFVFSPPSPTEGPKIARYIKQSLSRYSIVRIFRADTAIAMVGRENMPELHEWLKTAPTTPTARYRYLLNPIADYCRTATAIHCILIGTMQVMYEPIVDLECLRNRPYTIFTLALQRNRASAVWKETLDDLGIPYHYF